MASRSVSDVHSVPSGNTSIARQGHCGLQSPGTVHSVPLERSIPVSLGAPNSLLAYQEAMWYGLVRHPAIVDALVSFPDAANHNMRETRCTCGGVSMDRRTMRSSWTVRIVLGGAFGILLAGTGFLLVESSSEKETRITPIAPPPKESENPDGHTAQSIQPLSLTADRRVEQEVVTLIPLDALVDGAEQGTSSSAVIVPFDPEPSPSLPTAADGSSPPSVPPRIPPAAD